MKILREEVDFLDQELEAARAQARHGVRCGVRNNCSLRRVSYRELSSGCKGAVAISCCGAEGQPPENALHSMP